MSDPTIAAHRDLAATMGRACAKKRADYYGAAAAASAEQARRLRAMADVYATRATDPEAAENDCDD